MRYDKPPLAFAQQAKQLIDRGIIADHEQLTAILSNINYYRLSTYWYPFRNTDNTFKPNTSIEKILRRYTFDRQLRLIVMDAIERVEIAVKTKMTEIFTNEFNDGFAYLNREYLRHNGSDTEYEKLVENIRDYTGKSHEEFVMHFRKKYSEHKDLPLWMAIEIMTFGNMLIFYQELQKHIQVKIAAHFKIPGKVLHSWLRSLNYIRNICAHHGRLRDRELAIKPFIPEKRIQSGWHEPVNIKEKEHRIFSILSILCYSLKIVAPTSKWKSRLLLLLNEYNELPLEPMGFPVNWKISPIWQVDET